MSKEQDWRESIGARVAFLEKQFKELETAPQGCNCVKQPTPPLNVRVAKALGHRTTCAHCFWEVSPDDDGDWWTIPAYDTDLTLAMGALEEYCEKTNRVFKIEYLDGVSKQYGVKILYRGTGNTFFSEEGIIDTSLPTAICESICKHHEEGR